MGVIVNYRPRCWPDWCRRPGVGSVPEWLKGTGCKPVSESLRWFESSPAHCWFWGLSEGDIKLESLPNLPFDKDLVLYRSFLCAIKWQLKTDIAPKSGIKRLSFKRPEDSENTRKNHSKPWFQSLRKVRLYQVFSTRIYNPCAMNLM